MSCGILNTCKIKMVTLHKKQEKGKMELKFSIVLTLFGN